MKPTTILIAWKEIEGYSEATDVESFKSEINAEGCQAFVKAHPEFPQTQYSARKLQEWLTGLPLVRSNLERAYQSLDLGTLVAVEEPEPKPTKKPTVLKPMAAAQTAAPTEEEQEALEKLKDVPHLSDQQRKLRDAKLRSAAITSRNTHRKHARLLVG